MLTFFVKYIAHTRQFDWTCYSGNNREMFRSCYTIAGKRQAPKTLRNAVNHINSIGKQMHHHNIHITAEANDARKRLGEPLYGFFAPTERKR